MQVRVTTDTKENKRHIVFTTAGNNVRRVSSRNIQPRNKTSYRRYLTKYCETCSGCPNGWCKGCTPL